MLVCMSFSVIVLAVVVILFIRRHRTITHYNKDVILKSYTVNEESTHECIYPNPTYQDVQAVSSNNAAVSPNPTFQDVQDGDENLDISPNPTFQDVQDGGENLDISPNPTFQDVQDEDKKIDNEFSVQLED